MPARSPVAARVLASLPLYVPVVLAMVGCVSTALLLAGSFSGPVALGLGLVLSAGLLPFVGLGARRLSRSEVLADAGALGLAAGFAVINSRYAGQDLVVGRDPGTYSVAAKWLTTHASLDIDAQLGLFGPGGGIGTGSAGFGASTPGHLYAQGAHLVPELLAVVGSLLGDAVMYKANCLIGGLALLAVYGFGRLVVGRWLALGAAALIGLSLPQLLFSRDNFTEPLSQLFVMGGLALLWQARRGAWLQWLVAGLVLAASCMARIDAFLVLPPVVLYGALRLAVAVRGERSVVGRDVTALLVGAALPAVLGVRDLQVLSFGYYRDLHGQFTMITGLVAVSVVVAVVLVTAAWATPLLRVLDEHGEPWRRRAGDLAAGALVAAGLALAVRPLFGPVHGATNPGQLMFVRSLQGGLGSRIDPSRTYAENTVTWLAWYVGPLAVAASLVGIALLVRRAVRQRDLQVVPFLLFLLITAGLYLVFPSITPDQIWAMRRFVPVVVPGVALGAAYVLSLALPRVPDRFRLVALGAVVLAAFGPVLFISRPLLFIREGNGQLAEVRQVCDALPPNAAVVLVGDFSIRYTQTVRSFCGVPAVTQPVAGPGRLNSAVPALRSHGMELYLLGAEDSRGTVPAEVSAGGAPTPFSSIVVRIYARALDTPPRAAVPVPRTLYLGHVGADGLVDRWLTR